jgi:hypothetical protein
MAYTNIDDPSAYFQVKTGVGASSPQSHTFDGNSDLQPDLLWWKRRDANGNNTLHDSTRGANKYLYSNATTNEQTDGNLITSFNTDGWSTGSSWFDLGSQTWAVWAWKCNGGTTSSNTDGNTTTTVQANQDAGFSIVTYTGTGSSSQTMGHGLGVTPNIVLTKNRSGTGRAWSFNGNFGGLIYGTNKLILNQTSALTADTNDVTAASSTTFTGGGSNGVNANGVTYVAYCFAEKQGYSKFGTYVGNGNADGTFIYTGFKPAFIMVKTTALTDEWNMFDNRRSGFNVNNDALYASANYAEDAGSVSGFMDIVSNGFKLRRAANSPNRSTTYIYMAFAENPFTTSTGIPTTAR